MLKTQFQEDKIILVVRSEKSKRSPFTFLFLFRKKTVSAVVSECPRKYGLDLQEYCSLTTLSIYCDFPNRGRKYKRTLIIIGNLYIPTDFMPIEILESIGRCSPEPAII